MLDHEPIQTDDSLPKPPAGRRSRRRPAGPPEPVVTPPPEEQAVPEAPVSVIEETAPVVEAVELAEAVDVVEAVEEDAAEEATPPVAEDITENPIPAEEPSAETPSVEPSTETPTAEEPEDADRDGDETPSRRRRRRRGGRRRHASGPGQPGDPEADESTDAAEATPVATSEAPAPAAAGDAAGTDGREENSEQEAEDPADQEASSGTSRRRRRRRRRHGEDGGRASSEGPAESTSRGHEGHSGDDEVHGISGSTRLEAKRQRRREGRAAGRRRAPIVSEAEFLARRESVERRMVLRQTDEFTQIAVLEDNILVEHYVDRESSSSLIGSIYLGRVQNVLPSMEAAFIDIGRGRNAVLYAGEVDWDAYGAADSERKIENVLKSGQQVVVQVTKDPIGAKGARLTSHVSIPGRYVVYAPGGHLSGISRKLPDVERKRLKQILAELIEDGASVIVRTAAEGATREQLVHDVTRLKTQWDAIAKKAKQGGAPQQLYSEPDLTIRTVRDLFTEDFSELVIDGNGGEDDAYDQLADYLENVAPHLRERVVRWDRAQKGDVFAHYRLDEQIAKGLERKVHLPSGGSLVIDRTEAMTVIDVNTGKFTGHGGNLEATVTANNLEAAEEIVRQLRLRDIGGIIVVDFIDMVLPSNRELLLRRLVECLGRDRTRHQVSEVTSLGLVQLTRKRIGTGLAEAFTEPCEACNGRGYLIHDMPVATQAPADGGDRHKSSGRKRSKSGGRGSHTAARGLKDTQHAETISEEARAAAQAAMSAMAAATHNGAAKGADDGGAESRTPAEVAEVTLTPEEIEARKAELLAAIEAGPAPEPEATDLPEPDGAEPTVEPTDGAETPGAPGKDIVLVPEVADVAPPEEPAVPEDVPVEVEVAEVEGSTVEDAPEVPAARKRATRAATKTAATGTAAKRTTTKKAAAKKTTAKKATTRKAPAKKTAAAPEAAPEIAEAGPGPDEAVEATPAKKTTARKTAAKKTTARKTTARKTTARKSTPRKATPSPAESSEPAVGPTAVVDAAATE